MPKGGLEPARVCAHWLLKPARLPVPPLRLGLLRNGNLDCCITPSQCVSCRRHRDRKSTRLNSSHVRISYAVFCLKKKNKVYTYRPRHSRDVRDCLYSCSHRLGR